MSMLWLLSKFRRSPEEAWYLIIESGNEELDYVYKHVWKYSVARNYCKEFNRSAKVWHTGYTYYITDRWGKRV